MDDYTRYVTAVNKIFDYIEKMKAGWNNLDNRNYIDSINEYKSIVTSKAELIKRPPTVAIEKEDNTKESTDSQEVSVNDPPKQESTLDLNLDDEEDEGISDEMNDASEEAESRTFPQSDIQPASSNSIGIPELPDINGLIDVSSVIK